jgi:predicted nucleic acid-binding protein
MRVKALLLDASYLVALEASDDQNHKAAALHWPKLLKALPPLVTTTYVFDEVVTFFNTRGRHEKAVEVGNNILESASIELIHVDEALLYEAWEYLRKHRDKTYSLTDCMSFIVMSQRGMRAALTFDRHFVQAGFEKLP